MTLPEKVASRENLPANRDADACDLHMWSRSTVLLVLLITAQPWMVRWGNVAPLTGMRLDSTAQLALEEQNETFQRPKRLHCHPRGCAARKRRNPRAETGY